MKETIQLHLKAVDFENTNYTHPCKCAISKAAKRQLVLDDVREDVSSLTIENIEYDHEYYGYQEFRSDSIKATSAGFDNTTIRTITLTKAL